MEWINKVNDIINKQMFDLTKVGDNVYNELDIVLSLIQTNVNLSELKLEVKNYVSLLSNVLEKIALLAKEIALLRGSFDTERLITIDDKVYYYNFRLDTYLGEDDIRKLEEAHRRCLDLFKRFARKIIYLIVTGKEEKVVEEQPVQLQQPQPVLTLPTIPFLSKEEKEEEVKK